MRRPDPMAFAPGMHVFPGGRVDPAPTGCPIPGRCPNGSWAPERVGPSDAVAAVRETFEEAGVLLAVDRPAGAAAPDGTGPPSTAASELDRGFAALRRRRLHSQMPGPCWFRSRTGSLPRSSRAATTPGRRRRRCPCPGVRTSDDIAPPMAGSAPLDDPADAPADAAADGAVAAAHPRGRPARRGRLLDLARANSPVAR